MHFKKHSLNDFTLGELLRLRREERGASIEQAAAGARIKEVYVQALEDGNSAALPDGLYAKHVLREYCAYLELSYRRMVALYEREFALTADAPDTSRVFGRSRAPRRYFFLLPKLWRGVILGVIILAGLGYIGLRVQAVIAPPGLAVIFPPERYATSSREISVSGTVESHARLFMNGTEIVDTTDGAFSERVYLKEGMNDITVRAQKKYGRDAEVTRHVLVQ
ncbi:hypothetical protein A2477_01130 [Candidatus Falkowbacteria bacterium RIFOXYC2_FULL_47_12]|uniref:HTH cro/C1-type domain-containing protein n=1 Tax=Candidatus Falkowbacteria bacterium RIFOXYC2_FULL_47_12 TaxID=1798004 RepID=A0A1F5TQK7_9BACT|nr:MAG: hypothetical protein A2477_01130 [Candidatus Falkowbacteria bacterium RIFOXYC2_FULL_47_12]